MIRRSIEWIIIHHSLTKDNETVSWPAIKHYHTGQPPLGRGWTDIGYHGGIEVIDGEYQFLLGRDWAVPGAHAIGRNHDSLGFCLVGNFDDDVPNPDMWRLAVRKVADISAILNLSAERIRGHREVSEGRTCPGRCFDLNGFRIAVQKRMANL